MSQSVMMAVLLNVLYAKTVINGFMRSVCSTSLINLKDSFISFWLFGSEVFKTMGLAFSLCVSICVCIQFAAFPSLTFKWSSVHLTADQVEELYCHMGINH